MERYFDRDFQDVIEKIEKDILSSGHTRTDLCDENHFSRATLVRWKKTVPMTIKIIVQLQKTAERWKAEHEAATAIPGE